MQVYVLGGKVLWLSENIVHTCIIAPSVLLVRSRSEEKNITLVRTLAWAVTIQSGL